MCATTAKQPPASISVYFALDILIPLRGRYLEQNKTNTDIKARTVGWHILRKPISQKAIIPRKPISGKPTPGAPTFCPFINGAYRTQISSKLSPWYATPLHHVPLSTHLCKIASNKLLEKALFVPISALLRRRYRADGMMRKRNWIQSCQLLWSERLLRNVWRRPDEARRRDSHSLTIKETDHNFWQLCTCMN